MIAFDHDKTGDRAAQIDRLYNYIWLSDPHRQVIDLSKEKRPANAEEVIAWRKRKKKHAFKCFFKARVPTERKKVKRPYKKRDKNVII